MNFIDEPVTEPPKEEVEATLAHVDQITSDPNALSPEELKDIARLATQRIVAKEVVPKRVVAISTRPEPGEVKLGEPLDKVPPIKPKRPETTSGSLRRFFSNDPFSRSR